MVSDVEPTILLGLGGALGATARYLVGQLVAPRSRVATLLVNVVGSFLLGAVVFGPAGSDTILVVGTGFCGAFTTFSSFGFQTVECWERGERRAAAVNAAANLVCSIAAMALAAAVVG